MSGILICDARGLIQPCPSCGQRNRAAYENLGKPFRCSKCHAEMKLLGRPFAVGNEAVFDAIVARSTLPILVDFWAPWCGPCKMVAPEFNKVAASEAGKVLVAKVDVDRVPPLSIRHNISSIPTMAVFVGGREIARQCGAMPGPVIQRWLDGLVPSIGIPRP